jgi:hypothetical protein
MVALIKKDACVDPKTLYVKYLLNRGGQSPFLSLRQDSRTAIA